MYSSVPMEFVRYSVFGLAILLFSAWCFLWLVHLIGIIYAKYKFNRKPIALPRDQLPGVSILKPLVGVDPHLVTNLETFFTMDYPQYELLFCVQESTDPVISVVRRLMEKFPSVDARLFIGGKRVGINPKINNMIQGYESAKYGLILVSDAGLMMKEDTLFDMVSLMRDQIGLVHQMPFTCDRKGFAATLEKVYFGTQHARMYLTINWLGINCVTGMSCLMRKSVLDEAGGMQAFSNVIAEDYFFARAFLMRNWKILLSHQPAWQNSGSCSVSSWRNRMIRWSKLRVNLAPLTMLGEPIQESLMLGLLNMWATNLLFGWDPIVFFLVHVLVWFLLDYLLLSIVQSKALPFSKFEFAIAWLLRESMTYTIIAKAIMDPTVTWHDKRYRLKWGGAAEEIRTHYV